VLTRFVIAKYGKRERKAAIAQINAPGAQEREGKMTAWTINAKAEAALREALAAVSRLELDQIEPALDVLDERELGEALGLAILITGYVAIESCGTERPAQQNIQRIAEDLATTGTISRQLQLDSGRIRRFLSQVVLGPDHLDEFFTPEDPDLVRFPVIVANRATGVYCPKEIGIWDYIDQIESSIEAAWALRQESQ
jgi:hypothetical protein